MKLRPYQQEMEDRVYASWDAGNRNAMAVLPCGAGKTIIFSHIIAEHQGQSVMVAHRQELVMQMSVALASWGVQHNIIAPANVIKFIVNKHMREFNRSYFNPGSKATVAGVNTLSRRIDKMRSWFDAQTLFVIDETHHVLEKNIWGKVLTAMPNAKGLGVTATPMRASGEGLGRHADGIFDDMLVGPSMREIIDMGFLTDYRIFAVPSDVDVSGVDVSKSTGDFVPAQLKNAVVKSHITGDVVEHYVKHAMGKLGVTFVTDVETGTEIAAKYNAAGVPAEILSYKTDDRIRQEILERFENRDLLQIINVDLLGEGFNAPAIEVISMARPTQSYGLYVQQFGRALRLLEGKEKAIIFDHVGNVQRHGLPDMKNTWSLDRRDKRKRKLRDPDDIPVRVCVKCTGVYERIHNECPYCGYAHKPAQRNGPEHVDGELSELDTGFLRASKAKALRSELSARGYEETLRSENCPEVGIPRNVRAHEENKRVRGILKRITMMWMRQYAGATNGEVEKRFYWQTGYDMQSVKSLDKKEAKEVAECLLMNL